MSYKTELQNNNIDLQAILDSVNSLPEAGGGGGVQVSSVVKVTIHIDTTGYSSWGNPDCFIKGTILDESGYLDGWDKPIDMDTDVTFYVPMYGLIAIHVESMFGDIDFSALNLETEGDLEEIFINPYMGVYYVNSDCTINIPVSSGV